MIEYALNFGFVCVALALLMNLYRLTVGPTTADRVLAVDTMAIKCRRALKETGLKRIVLAGGVSANRGLRQRMERLGQELGAEIFYPRPEFCTDNGAMIAYAGWCRLKAGEVASLSIDASPRWSLETLTAVQGTSTDS